MSVIAVTIAYAINPALSHDKFYMLSVIMIVFWGCTFINCLGMKAASRLSNFSAVVGTLVPMLFIIVLGFVWIMLGKPINISFNEKSFFLI